MLKKKNYIIYATIVLMLGGCGVKEKTVPRPTIEPIEINNYICFTPDDASDLMIYVRELEGWK